MTCWLSPIKVGVISQYGTVLTVHRISVFTFWLLTNIISL